MRSSLLCGFLWLICGFFAAVCAAEPLKAGRFVHYMQHAEDSIGEVLSITQDRFGFVWLGGRNGLARYDAYSYHIYRHDSDSNGSISANAVYDLLVDQAGYLWVATELGLNRYDYKSGRFIHYFYQEDNPRSLSHNTVYRIHEDSSGGLWFATQEGLNRYNAETDDIDRVVDQYNPKIYKSYTLDVSDDGQGHYYLATGFGLIVWHKPTDQVSHFNTATHSELKSHLMRSVMVDSRQRVWVATDTGLYRYLPEVQGFKYIAPKNIKDQSDTPVWDIYESADGVIWVAKDGGGLNYLEEETQLLVSFMRENNNANSISSNVVRRVNQTDNGDLWVGMFPSGVDVYSKYFNSFERYTSRGDQPFSLTVNNVRGLYAEEGQLWVGTDGGGLNILDVESGSVDVISARGSSGASGLATSEVLAIEKDRSGQIWLGSWSSGITRYNPLDQSYKYYRHDMKEKNSLTSNHVWDIFEDSHGTIWVATISGGLNYYIPEIDGFGVFHADDDVNALGDERIWSIAQSDENTLWLATQTGLSRFNINDQTFYTYRKDKTRKNSISGNRILSVMVDSLGKVWAGTHSGGLNLYDPEVDGFESIGVKQGLQSNVINAILEGPDNIIWVSSDKGISSYNPETKKVRNYSQVHGIQPKEFNIGSSVSLPNGDLVFGGLEGVTRFDPKGIMNNDKPNEIVFTELNIANNRVYPKDDSHVLDSSFLTTKKFNLTYKQNVFSIRYAGLGYRESVKNSYAYMLMGFDDGWRHVGSEMKASYTNLDPGSYRFLVKSANNEGVWGTPIYVDVEILPPPWRTWWAYSAYALILGVLVCWYVLTQKKILDRERVFVKKLKNLDRLKDEFLANTSHELRTPLFGMIGLAEGMVHDAHDRFSKMDLNNLSMIVASARRLSAIVEDVLDFSKINNNNLSLDVKPVDVNAVVGIVVALITPLIQKKELVILNNVPPEIPPILGDENRLQQILHNLIGNAVKFTQKGEISISAEAIDDYVEICVSDTGCGIPKGRFNELFDNFTQIDESDVRSQGGTGLGLAITKNLVELHGGTVRVESILGEGSQFYFTIPQSSVGGTVDSINISEKIVNRIQADGMSTLTMDATSAVQGDRYEDPSISENGLVLDHMHGGKILVVDDEPVNRRVLRNHLVSEGYQVEDVHSGHEAIKRFKSGAEYDLVLMDVMMPMISGYDTCREIRGLYSRHSLPIIFITAKYQVHDIITGFDAGGNDFVSKPIARQELLARVDLHLQLLKASRSLEDQVEARTRELRDAYDQLESLSNSDPLTGLGNRRFFENFIENDISGVNRNFLDSIRLDHPVADNADIVFMMVDVDHFKSVNDNYGHAVGDSVLVTVSKMLKELCRNSDHIVRWGGEEFLVIARFMSRGHAEALAERIRNTLAEKIITTEEGANFSVTCSIGFAAYPVMVEEPVSCNWETTIKIADSCLYAAKNSGRNTWVGAMSASAEVSSLSEFHARLAQNAIHIVSSMDDVDEIQWKTL